MIYGSALLNSPNVLQWLLYLLAEPDSRVVVLASKILARLLVANGPQYVKKFTEKTGGFTILKNRLKTWWNTPGIWTICFALLFGVDVAKIDFERDFDVFNLVEIFVANQTGRKLEIAYPAVFTVITAMLDTGLRAIVKDPGKAENEQPNAGDGDTTVTRGRRRTMSLNAKQPTVGKNVRLGLFLQLTNTCRYEGSTSSTTQRLCWRFELGYPISIRASLQIRFVP